MFRTKLPITRVKLFFANILYRIVSPFCRKKEMIINRKGINFNIDLSEGFDLSLYLFGDFQSHVSENKYIQLNSDSIVFDIGANFGIMSLSYAKRVKKGHVFAFEPTDFAFRKFQKNLIINPELNKRITLNKSYINHSATSIKNPETYSSWKIDTILQKKSHSVHGGIKKSCTNTQFTSLDNYVNEHNIKHVDLIKIDTDGNEYPVIIGAEQVIQMYRPQIIFEIGEYALKRSQITMKEYFDFFNKYNYKLFDSRNKNIVTRSNWRHYIPINYSIDLLALPDQING